MTGLLARADAVLRGEPRGEDAPSAKPAALLALVLAYGCLYGALMGTFTGLAGERWLQVVFSAVKVPILLLVTMALSLPSFFVLHTLLGLRADFPEVLRALLSAQAGLTAALASLAPFTLTWYASSDRYQAAVLFNGLMFGVAAIAGQLLLRRHYRPLVARNARHLLMLRLWLGLYGFVGIQMAWVLRPFIGAPWGRPQFFREDSWGNAYVMLARMLRDVLAP